MKSHYVPGDVLEETVTNTLFCLTCGNDMAFDIEAGEALPALVYCWRCGGEIDLVRIVYVEDTEGKYSLDELLGGAG